MPRHEYESVADLNAALEARDWRRAEKAVRDLDERDQDPTGPSIVDAFEKTRNWVESAIEDAGSLLPDECEQWYPYKPAYVSYTPEGKFVWRCTHGKDEGGGPHEREVSE